MPETLFQVRWPDDASETCYSPSSVIAGHLEAGRSYTVRAFLDACTGGLHAASDRVREVYGGNGCSRAAAQLVAIQIKARCFEENETVRVESIDGGLRRSA